MLYEAYNFNSEDGRKLDCNYISSVNNKIIFERNIQNFPNPTSGIINITGLNEPANIKIFNPQGQLLKSYNQVNNIIDLANLNKGVYVLNLMVGEKRVVRKIVKE
jgi:hypothetical protein